MRRILLLCENYPPDRGGMAQSCDRIVRGLRQGGLGVDVAHLSARHRRLDVETQFGGRLWRCPLEEDSEHALNLAWNALAAAPQPPAAVLAFGGALPLLAAPVFAAWWGVPLLVLLRGNDFDAGILSTRRGWVLREALARAASVATVSAAMRDKVAALYPQTPVVAIGNGIDGEHWQLHDFDRAQAQRWRRETVAPGRRVIGLFGHLKQKKGGALLLEALQRSGLGAHVHLLVVGEIEDALRSALDALAATTGISCLPFMDRFELLPWYAGCDLVAIPSHYDGMPNVALEAAGLGIPLLASRVGGLADLLPEHDYPLQFPPGDLPRCIEALARAVALGSADLCALGASLQARVQRAHTGADEISRYQALLRSLLSAADSVDAAALDPVPLTAP